MQWRAHSGEIVRAEKICHASWCSPAVQYLSARWYSKIWCSLMRRMRQWVLAEPDAVL